MLSGTSGLLGVMLGMAIPWLVTWLAGMKTIITFWSPLVAFSISALVGVVFGLYPALRAARMDPVETLRQRVMARAAPAIPLLRPAERNRTAKTQRRRDAELAESFVVRSHGRMRPKCLQRAAGILPAEKSNPNCSS